MCSAEHRPPRVELRDDLVEARVARRAVPIRLVHAEADERQPLDEPALRELALRPVAPRLARLARGVDVPESDPRPRLLARYVAEIGAEHVGGSVDVQPLVRPAVDRLPAGEVLRPVRADQIVRAA